VKKTSALLLFLAFFSTALAQWQFGIGFSAVNKATRFSESTLPLGGSTVLSARSPSMLGNESNWFLSSGIALQGGSSGTKCIDINKTTSRLYDNSLVAHTLDIQFGRTLNNWIVLTEALGGHLRVYSGYEENQQGAKEILSNSRVFRYGVGLGVGYQFNEDVKLLLGTRFTRSGSVDYLDLKSIRLLEASTSKVGYTVATSDYSDLFSVGLTFVFICSH